MGPALRIIFGSMPETAGSTERFLRKFTAFETETMTMGEWRSEN